MKRPGGKIIEQGGLKNRLFPVKIAASIALGKMLTIATRLLGRGGTTLPGRIAIKIMPAIVAALAGQLHSGVLLVTGTNGKTTTSALINMILQAQGCKYIHNQSGSNMLWGIASALIEGASLNGRVPFDWALMEVDEGAFPYAVGETKPSVIVVTNIFRDQLDRYGEIDRIRAAIEQGLIAQPAGGYQVINADDPSLVSLEGSKLKKRLTYGLEIEPPDDGFQNTGRDTKTCPRCKKELHYDKIYFAHLGHYHCPACSFARPDPDVSLQKSDLKPDGSVLLEFNVSGRSLSLLSPLPGIYNLYNLLAALTASLALAVPAEMAVLALEKATPSFGRMEKFTVDEKQLIIALVKNPVGANEVLRTIMRDTTKATLLVVINDKIADGTDVSWLWDVDFEQLAGTAGRLNAIIASGLRAWDMAVRFKYAGLEPQQFIVEENSEQALLKALQMTPPLETIYILPTYTAMLEIRRYLNRIGFGKPYWENRS